MISKQELLVRNPWWESGLYQIKAANMPKRDLYTTIQENLYHPLILNIVGLRRVGKSVLIKQIISHLLEEKIEPKNIFYYLFDYSNQLQAPEFLDDVIRSYLSQILNKQVYEIQDRVYIFLDEIQYIDNWQSVLKRYYDLSYEKIKFVITGSQSLLLRNRQLESLAGRIFDFYLPPMSFREYLTVAKTSIGVVDKFDLFNLPDDFNKLVFSGYRNELTNYCNDYITGGEFPETLNFNSYPEKHDYIVNSVIGKVIDDCIKIYKIAKTDDFKLIANHIIANASSIFETENIAREIGLSKKTIKKYTEYLKEGYIYDVMYKYHKSLIKRGRILKKVYTPSVNFTCALNHLTNKHISEVPQAFGKIVENAVYNALKQKYPVKFYMDSLTFWRKGTDEIDFILTQKGKHLPIEVKFTNKIEHKDVETLVHYIKTKNLNYGVLVTKDELDEKKMDGQTIYYIPYYLILLMT